MGARLRTSGRAGREDQGEGIPGVLGVLVAGQGGEWRSRTAATVAGIPVLQRADAAPELVAWIPVLHEGSSLAQGLSLGVGVAGIVVNGTWSLASPLVVAAAVVGVEVSAGVGGRARPPQPAPGPPAAPGARGSGGPPVQPAAAAAHHAPSQAHAAAEGTGERSAEKGRRSGCVGRGGDGVGALREEAMKSGCVGRSGGQARVEDRGSDWGGARSEARAEEASSWEFGRRVLNTSFK